MKVAFIDFETTGLNPSTGHVIEAAVILMECDDIKPFRIVDVYSSFNDPKEPIPEFIQKLTHITNDLVKSKKLDWDRFTKIVDQADVIVAHNMKFDRLWLAAHGNYREKKKYACSMEMIEWKTKHNQSCKKLQHLGFEHDIIMKDRHRALSDVKLLIKLLKKPSIGNPDKTYFQEMMESLVQERFLVEVWFDYNYENKEYVKSLGFRWNSIKKCWYKNVVNGTKDEIVKSLDSKGLTKWNCQEVK